jgi:hypothetical protein
MAKLLYRKAATVSYGNKALSDSGSLRTLTGDAASMYSVGGSSMAQLSLTAKLSRTTHW